MEDRIIYIKPKTGLLEIEWGNLLSYKDLIFLFVKRSFISKYKQTILGPLWFLINPLITSFIYTIVFGKIAGLSTEGVPQLAFYLCSTAIWQYFAACFMGNANTFVDNAGIFGKVYFPRITMPISTVIFSLINFAVTFLLSCAINIYYAFTGQGIYIGIQFLLVPLLLVQTALLGLGCGIIVSSLTTKYRDLQVLVSFGVQLWMYATPVVYSSSVFSGKARQLIMLNPMSPIVCNYRYAMLGCGEFELKSWAFSWVVTLFISLVGIVMFNRVEKTFMDLV